MSDQLVSLSAPETRILGSLVEKKELTPDIYPLTLNALLSAANQKTAREPVMALEPGDISRALTLLQQKGLVRQQFASRVERYEHLMAQAFSLTHGQIAIMGLLMLRGPQTAHELLARSERMARYDGIESLKSDLDLLIGRRPPLVQHIERGPAQREDRYAHLFGGPVQSFAASAVTVAPADLELRVQALEERLAELEAKLAALGG